MGVGAAGGATKATVANVLKAKGHAHQSAVARASWTKVRQQVQTAHKSGLYLTGVVRFSPEGGCFARNHFKRSVSARFIAYEASSHRTSPRGSSWVQALPGKFRGNHNPGFDRGNFCPFPGAYLGSHTPGIPGISGSTWEHTHPGAYSGRETRVFPGGRWEPRNNPGQNLGKTRVLGLSRVFPGWCCWGL